MNSVLVWGMVPPMSTSPTNNRIPAPAPTPSPAPEEPSYLSLDQAQSVFDRVGAELGELRGSQSILRDRLDQADLRLGRLESAFAGLNSDVRRLVAATLNAEPALSDER